MAILRPNHPMFLSDGPIFIHIGKCGGSTLRTVIKHKYEIHLQRVKFSNDDKYFISLRNPIDRFISAFYYRKNEFLSGRGGKYNLNESKIFNSVDNVYDFTENLFDYNIENVNGVAHIGESISYYLSPIITKLNKKNVTNIFTTHFLDEELKKVVPDYKRKVLKDNSKNKPNKKLSELSIKNLNKFLEKDFKIIDELYKKDLLTDKQYEILSKKDGW